MTQHQVTQHQAGDEVARLLLPYCRREILEDGYGPDHESGWWFTDAPPEVTREALALTVDRDPGMRPNDQPPEEWLVAEAERRGGVLAGFVAPKGPGSPRMRVDAIIVPCSQAEDLAAEIARLWPVEDYGTALGTALDLAIVEGLVKVTATRHEWDASGSEFLTWRARADGWLGAEYCSFWWD
jgi:hypothetical protein